MISRYIKSRFPSLSPLLASLRSVRFELRLLFYHIRNNSFRLHRQLLTKNKLHFGAGHDMKPGFINIDINGLADLFLDARAKLKIPDDSIEYIYSSHFVEHLKHEELVFHLKECYRFLKPGGVLRIGVPEFPKVFKSYCMGDQKWLEDRRQALSKSLKLPPELICAMDYVNNSVHENGEHHICLDLEKIRNLLIFAGFTPSKVNASEFNLEIDVASREAVTFHVEAVK